MEFSFSDAVFTYCVASKRIERFGSSYSFLKHNLCVNYTRGTCCFYARFNGREICIIGLCIDSHDKYSRNNIPNILVSECGDIDKLVLFSKRLAGSYVIIFDSGEEIYVIPDATGSIPINYYVGEPCVASSARFIADFYRLCPSDKLLAVRNSAKTQKVMPVDMTLYSDVRVVLPNHYLAMCSGTVHRFYPYSCQEPPENYDIYYIGEITKSRVLAIQHQYMKEYDVICPLTAGTDSRMNLAFLRYAGYDVNCFTMRHRGRYASEDDCIIPAKICNDLNIRYELVEDIEPSDECMNYILKNIDEISPSCDISYITNTARLLTTIKTSFPKKAIINGNIIGHVAKIGLFHERLTFIPSTYLLHLTACTCSNYNSDARAAVKRWADELNQTGDTGKAIVYSLYSQEIQLGKHAAFNSNIYALCGLTNLNLYNCFELIELWETIPESIREIGLPIHDWLFSNMAPELTRYPFNPSSHAIKNDSPLRTTMAVYYRYIRGMLSSK